MRNGREEKSKSCQRVGLHHTPGMYYIFSRSDRQEHRNPAPIALLTLIFHFARARAILMARRRKTRPAEFSSACCLTLHVLQAACSSIGSSSPQHPNAGHPMPDSDGTLLRAPRNACSPLARCCRMQKHRGISWGMGTAKSPNHHHPSFAHLHPVKI
jgi:hypothetical protein